MWTSQLDQYPPPVKVPKLEIPDHQAPSEVEDAARSLVPNESYFGFDEKNCPVYASTAASDRLPNKREFPEDFSQQMNSNPPPLDVDLRIRNVVAHFSVKSHIDLKKFGLTVCHVYYDRSKGVLAKQMRNPKCFVKVFSSGKVSVVGCQSEETAKIASRRVARLIQKCIPRARFCDYRVSNILATCRLPFGVRVEKVNEGYPKETQYEPELNVGLIWRSIEPKATLRIYTTGNITLTGATSTEGIMTVLSDLIPKLEAYQGPRSEKKEKRGLDFKEEIPDDFDFEDDEDL